MEVITATPIIVSPADQLTLEAQTAPGGIPVPALTITQIEAENFTDGLFAHSGTLFWQTPRADYALLSVPEEAFQAAGGWTVITVKGDYFVPNLLAEKTVSGEPVSASYRTNEGALLFHFADNVTPLDETWTRDITYNIIVDGNLTTLRGDYTLTISPAMNAIDLNSGARDVTVPQGQPVVLHFTPQPGTVYYLTMQVVSVIDENSPNIAVLLPGGETLTTFDPNRTAYLAAEFVPTVAEGDQYLLLYPQDVCAAGIPLDECRAQTRQNITSEHTGDTRRDGESG